MARLKVTASLHQLDRERYLKDFQSALKQAALKAARAFLLAASPQIPVWTGFSKGALGNLEDIAGRVVGTTIRTSRQGRTRGFHLRPRKHYYYPPGGARVLKTTVSGRQFATAPGDIITSGQLSGASTGTRIMFKFEVDITYFNMLDKSKWGAFLAGQQAFSVAFKQEIERLKPRVGNYMIRKELK